MASAKLVLVSFLFLHINIYAVGTRKKCLFLAHQMSIHNILLSWRNKKKGTGSVVLLSRVMIYSQIIIPPAKGVYSFHRFRPSIHLSVRPSVSPSFRPSVPDSVH